MGDQLRGARQEVVPVLMGHVMQDVGNDHQLISRGLRSAQFLWTDAEEPHPRLIAPEQPAGLSADVDSDKARLRKCLGQALGHHPIAAPNFQYGGRRGDIAADRGDESIQIDEYAAVHLGYAPLVPAERPSYQWTNTQFPLCGLPSRDCSGIQYIRLLGSGYLAFSVGRMSFGDSNSVNQRLQYTPLEAIPVGRPVDRVRYIAAACAGQRVLDLGAMDETAWQSKRGQGTWLHEEIAKVAARVDGIDNSKLIPAEGLQTAPNGRIRRGDIADLRCALTELDAAPEVVVAGELIEHVENPLQLLRTFQQTDGLAGGTLILSTPNATGLHNFLIGLARRESTHHDHLCILSYKTLSTLCRRAGFRDWTIIPYYARFTEMQGRHSGLARLAIRAVERAINCLEWLFPMLSFGYIVKARL